MPSAFGDLNGGGNQQIWINVFRTGQDWGANRTDYYGEVRYYGNGYGSWDARANAWGWEANFGGFYVGGRFGVPFAERNQQYHVLWSGNFSRFHDSEGYLGGFYASAWIDTDHNSIGDGGANTTEEGAPRIPKPPTAPQNLRVEALLPTSAGVRYDGPADERGARVEQYRARWFMIDYSTNPVIWTDDNSFGYTNPGGGAGPVLKPGQVYHVYISARNAAGWGPETGIALKTVSGAYVWNGSAWAPTEVFVWNGSAWVSAEVNTWTGSGWSAAG